MGCIRLRFKVCVCVGVGRLRIQLKLYDLFPDSGSDSAGLGYRMSLKLTEGKASHALVPSVGGLWDVGGDGFECVLGVKKSHRFQNNPLDNQLSEPQVLISTY